MDRREPCLQRRRSHGVVEPGKERQLVVPHAHGPGRMPCNIPAVCVILDARYGTLAQVLKTGIHRRRDVKIGDVGKLGLPRTGLTINVHAEFCVMVHVLKKIQLVLKLKMIPQSRIHRLPKRPSPRIVVDSLGVQKGRNPVLPADHPRLREEAFVKVGLHALQNGIVLEPVEKVLRPLGLFKGRQVVFPQPVFFQGFPAQGGQPGRRKGTQHEKGLRIAHDAPFVPLHLDPGGIPQDQVEPAPVGEEIGELQFPVEKAVTLRKFLHEGQARDFPAEAVHVHEAEGVRQVS